MIPLSIHGKAASKSPLNHNLDVVRQADFLIDLGPEGGERGGELLASGTPEEVAKCERSYTAMYLGEEAKKGKKKK